MTAVPNASQFLFDAQMKEILEDIQVLANNYLTSLSIQVLLHSPFGKGFPKIVKAEPVGGEFQVVLELLHSSSLSNLFLLCSLISSVFNWHSMKLFNWASREAAPFGEKAILGNILQILAVSGGDLTGFGTNNLDFLQLCTSEGDCCASLLIQQICSTWWEVIFSLNQKY